MVAASCPEAGDGVPDHAQTLAGYRKAAAQGDAWAQFNLGVDYSQGRNAPQDCVQAYAWFSLAASIMSPDYLREMATGHRDLEAAKMTAAQIAEAEGMAREWKPKCEAMPTSSKPPVPYKPAPTKLPIGDLVIISCFFAFFAWLLFSLVLLLWNTRADIAPAVARFFDGALYDIVFGFIRGVVIVAPILLIPVGEEKFMRMRSKGWTTPPAAHAAELIRYRLVTWTLYAAGLGLFFLYENPVLGRWLLSPVG